MGLMMKLQEMPEAVTAERVNERLRPPNKASAWTAMSSCLVSFQRRLVVQNVGCHLLFTPQ